MNYIGLIKNFWQLHQMHQFTVTEIALYFHLLEVCNLCSWTNPFKRNNARISADLGVTYKTLLKARNRLVQFNLIEVSTKPKNPNVQYVLVSKSKTSGNFTDDKDDVRGDDRDDDRTMLGVTKDKLNETKHISTTSTCEDKFKISELVKIFLNDQHWLEVVCMKHREITGSTDERIKTVTDYLRKFETHLGVRKVEKKEKKDFPQHFDNWLNKVLLEKEKSSAKKEKENTSKFAQNKEAANIDWSKIIANGTSD